MRILTPLLHGSAIQFDEDFRAINDHSDEGSLPKAFVQTVGYGIFSLFCILLLELSLDPVQKGIGEAPAQRAV